MLLICSRYLKEEPPRYATTGSGSAYRESEGSGEICCTPFFARNIFLSIVTLFRVVRFTVNQTKEEGEMSQTISNYRQERGCNFSNR
ncbi:MAG TPA: hypothetical protein VE978_01285 [Chitinophagales bacterium]|nr:hypothetical protein [Chitinophagales bacterium]